MKARTRIMLISSAAVLTATLIADILILITNWGTQKSWAFMREYQSLEMEMGKVERLIMDEEWDRTDLVLLKYFFPRYPNESTLCFRVNEEQDIFSAGELYNNTPYPAQDIRTWDYEVYNTAGDVSSGEMEDNGQHFVVYRWILYNGQVEVYHLKNITYVWEGVVDQFVQFLLIMLIITAAAVIIPALVLSFTLRPLQELIDTTRKMAENKYGQRVKIRRRDEIGELGESFNKMAEAVEARTRSLVESEKRKTLFMGNLTHELKTPMTAMSGYAQTLLSTRISPREQEEALHYIYKECGRLERLSKKMMQLLELDQENTLEFSDVPVKYLFEETKRSCREILRAKQIMLECHEHGENFHVEADLMADVLINLVDNAVKASTPGSRILLIAEDSRIIVQDFGRGIPKEEQEKILEPFYMIDKSRSRKSGGAGLGLSLVSLILRKHSISLHIDSAREYGTRMILQFPSDLS